MPSLQKEANMAKTPMTYVIGRKFFVANKASATATVGLRISPVVRLGFWIIRLGAWICGISIKEEEAE